jgi:deoxyribonuclease V
VWQERLQRISGKLGELGAPKIFGVREHRGKLGSPLSVAPVADFERRHGISPPAGYRDFVTLVGHGGRGRNGGAVPFYGLLPLDRWDEALAQDTSDGALSKPFPVVPGRASGEERRSDVGLGDDDGWFAYERWLDAAVQWRRVVVVTGVSVLGAHGRYAAVDVHYPGAGGATAALLIASDPAFATVVIEHTVRLSDVARYRPGAFYLRELPALRAALADSGHLDLLVVDGYVDLDPDGRPGLGAHAHAQFGVPVIGVAKTAFRSATHAIEVRRGDATRPLYVTAIGTPAIEAADRVRAMAGPYRLPDALRRVDALSPGCPSAPRPAIRAPLIAQTPTSHGDSSRSTAARLAAATSGSTELSGRSPSTTGWCCPGVERLVRRRGVGRVDG